MLTIFLVATLAITGSFLPVYEHGRGQYVDDLCIGGDEADEDHSFLLPAAVCSDSHGNIFVLEAKDKVIEKFDAQGNLLLTFSRSGEGPGEMDMAFVMVVDAQDRVIIWDHSYHRFTVFDNEGELVDTVSYQPTVQAMAASATGHVFVETHQQVVGHAVSETLVRLVRLSSRLDDPTVVDSMRVVESQIIQSSPTSTTSVTLPFVAGLAWALTPDGGVVVGHTDQHRIRRYSRELELRGEIELAARRVATEEEDRQRYLTSFGSESEVFLDLVQSQIHFPEHTPYFASLTADHEGYLLAGRYDDVEGGHLFEVFSPQGDPVGEVVVPNIDRADLRHGFVYRARRREDSLPEVCRFRLEPADQP